MSQSLHITCIDCRKTLWAGQRSNSRGWEIYGTLEHLAALNKFIDYHIAHHIVFQDGDCVGFDVEDVTEYDES